MARQDFSGLRSSKTQATAYCKEGRLCVVGVHQSSLGPVPFATSVRVDGEVEDGPIDLTAELSPYVERAMQRCQRPIAGQIEMDTMRLGAEDLVIRSRAGDQVAIATITEVAKNAKRGFARAVKSRKLIQEAIAAVPLRPIDPIVVPRREKRAAQKFASVVVGSEPTEQYAAHVIMLLPTIGWRGVVVLANGPSLIRSGRMRVVAKGLSNPLERHAFCLACKHAGAVDRSARAKMPPKLRHALQLGESFGIAQKIQAVRQPGSCISDFDIGTGWELGE